VDALTNKGFSRQFPKLHAYLSKKHVDSYINPYLLQIERLVGKVSKLLQDQTSGGKKRLERAVSKLRRIISNIEMGRAHVKRCQELSLNLKLYELKPGYDKAKEEVLARYKKENPKLYRRITRMLEEVHSIRLNLAEDAEDIPGVVLRFKQDEQKGLSVYLADINSALASKGDKKKIQLAKEYAREYREQQAAFLKDVKAMDQVAEQIESKKTTDRKKALMQLRQVADGLLPCDMALISHDLKMELQKVPLTQKQKSELARMRRQADLSLTAETDSALSYSVSTTDARATADQKAAVDGEVEAIQDGLDHANKRHDAEMQMIGNQTRLYQLQNYLNSAKKVTKRLIRVASLTKRLIRERLVKNLRVMADQMWEFNRKDSKRVQAYAGRLIEIKGYKNLVELYLKASFIAESGLRLAKIREQKKAVRELAKQEGRLSKMARGALFLTMGPVGLMEMKKLKESAPIILRSLNDSERHILAARKLHKDGLNDKNKKKFLYHIKASQIHARGANKMLGVLSEFLNHDNSQALATRVSLAVTAIALLTTHLASQVVMPYLEPYLVGLHSFTQAAAGGAVGGATFTTVQTAGNVGWMGEQFSWLNCGEDLILNTIMFTVFGYVMKGVNASVGKQAVSEASAKSMRWFERLAAEYKVPGVAEALTSTTRGSWEWVKASAKLLGTATLKELGTITAEAGLFKEWEAVQVALKSAGLTTRERQDFSEGMKHLFTWASIVEGITMVAGLRLFHHVTGPIGKEVRSRQLAKKIKINAKKLQGGKLNEGEMWALTRKQMRFLGMHYRMTGSEKTMKLLMMHGKIAQRLKPPDLLSVFKFKPTYAEYEDAERTIFKKALERLSAEDRTVLEIGPAHYKLGGPDAKIWKGRMDHVLSKVGYRTGRNGTIKSMAKWTRTKGALRRIVETVREVSRYRMRFNPGRLLAGVAALEVYKKKNWPTSVADKLRALAESMGDTLYPESLLCERASLLSKLNPKSKLFFDELVSWSNDYFSLWTNRGDELEGRTAKVKFHKYFHDLAPLGMWRKAMDGPWVENLGLGETAIKNLRGFVKHRHFRDHADHWITLVNMLQSMKANQNRVKVVNAVLRSTNSKKWKSVKNTMRTIRRLFVLDGLTKEELNTFYKEWATKLERNDDAPEYRDPRAALREAVDSTYSISLLYNVSWFYDPAAYDLIFDEAPSDSRQMESWKRTQEVKKVLVDKGIFRLFVKAATYMEWNTGIEVMRDLLSELAKSEVVDGKIDYQARYDRMTELGFRSEFIDRWRADWEGEVSSGGHVEVTGNFEAMMLHTRVPTKTCQDITEPSSNTRDGQPLNRVRWGQFKVANFKVGGEVVARSLVEVTMDKQGNEHLIVEGTYAVVVFRYDAEVDAAILRFASERGIARERVHFAERGDYGPDPLETGDHIYRDSQVTRSRSAEE
jgi:hypothetical protein